MSFLGEHFYEHECPFNLNGSILSGSLFSEINMNCANLSGSDMSRTRLIGVQLEDADCTEAVFTETIWKDVKISPWSNFDKAVFRDADFNGLDICGGKIYDEFSLLQMTNASFVHANMLHCGLHYVNLSSSSMRNALLSDACFNTVALSSADLSGAIMTNAVFKHDGVYPNAFPPEVFAKMHIVNGMVLPGFELYIDVEGERKQLCPAFHANLEKATLAQSQISRYNWNGSRIADCNFTFAEIKDCIFDSCFGKNVTFRDAVICNSKFTHAMLNSADLSYAEISSCDFSDANLQGCLFIHKTDIGNDGHINGCCFDRSNFSGSQFQGCVFVNCSFKNANFAETTLMNVEFKNCTFLKTANCEDSYQIDVRGLPTAQKQAGGKKQLQLLLRGLNMYTPDFQRMTMLDVIMKRKSTRLFDEKKTIEPVELERILRAALQAPSPKNRQPWHFTVVTGDESRRKAAQVLEETLARLKQLRIKVGAVTDDLELAAGSVRAMKTAAAVVFVEYIRDIANEHGDDQCWELSARPFEVADLQSIGAAIQNLLLEATASGIASLWMCDVLYAVPELSTYLGLKHTLIAAVALGYESRRATPRFGIEEKVTFID